MKVLFFHGDGLGVHRHVDEEHDDGKEESVRVAVRIDPESLEDLIETIQEHDDGEMPLDVCFCLDTAEARDIAAKMIMEAAAIDRSEQGLASAGAALGQNLAEDVADVEGDPTVVVRNMVDKMREFAKTADKEIAPSDLVKAIRTIAARQREIADAAAAYATDIEMKAALGVTT